MGGQITDPLTGKNYGLKDAKAQGLIDDRDFDVANRATKAVFGFPDPLNPGRVCSLFEAVKEGYVAEGRALKLLEAQLATGGIYDINKGIRVPISTALKRSLCDSRFINKFKDLSRTGEGKYTDPNTLENNLTYLDLIKRTVTDRTNNAVLLV